MVGRATHFQDGISFHAVLQSDSKFTYENLSNIELSSIQQMKHCISVRLNFLERVKRRLTVRGLTEVNATVIFESCVATAVVDAAKWLLLLLLLMSMINSFMSHCVLSLVICKSFAHVYHSNVSHSWWLMFVLYGRVMVYRYHIARRRKNNRIIILIIISPTLHRRRSQSHINKLIRFININHVEWLCGMSHGQGQRTITNTIQSPYYTHTQWQSVSRIVRVEIQCKINLIFSIQCWYRMLISII